MLSPPDWRTIDGQILCGPAAPPARRHASLSFHKVVCCRIQVICMLCFTKWRRLHVFNDVHNDLKCTIVNYRHQLQLFHTVCSVQAPIHTVHLYGHGRQKRGGGAGERVPCSENVRRGRPPRSENKVAQIRCHTANDSSPSQIFLASRRSPCYGHNAYMPWRLK